MKFNVAPKQWTKGRLKKLKRAARLVPTSFDSPFETSWQNLRKTPTCFKTNPADACLAARNALLVIDLQPLQGIDVGLLAPDDLLHNVSTFLLVFRQVFWHRRRQLRDDVVLGWYLNFWNGIRFRFGCCWRKAKKVVTCQQEYCKCVALAINVRPKQNYKPTKRIVTTKVYLFETQCFENERWELKNTTNADNIQMRFLYTIILTSESPN